MFGSNKLKLMFFNESKHGQEGNITQYLSLADLINLSKVSPEANRLSKIHVQKTCFSHFIQFMSHPDILDEPIIDNEEPVVISRYPNEREIIDLKKSNDILNVLNRITSPLYLDLKYNLNSKFVKDPFKLLLIPEMFLLSELHESIHNKLKITCYFYSECSIKNIISAIRNNVILDSEGKLDPVFVESGKMYKALPYKTAYFKITTHLRFELRFKMRQVSYIEHYNSSYDVNNFNDEALQFLFDHKLIYFDESKIKYDGHDCFESPIMQAARYGSLKLFELISHALPPHNNYYYNFWINWHDDIINGDQGGLRSPLMVAARFNRIDILKQILENEKTVAPDLIKSDDKGWTALMHASCEGHVEVVKLMIQKASSLGLVSELINFCGSSNQTALTIAAYTGKLEIVQQLFPYIEQQIKVEGNRDQNQQSINQVEVALKFAKHLGYKAIVDFLQSSLGEEEKPANRQCRLM